jgi:transposase
MISFLQTLPATEIVMEAFGGSHHWSRVLTGFGHKVLLIPPQYVKPYVKRGTNDRNDAEAICEAAGRPGMHFVAMKTVMVLPRPSLGETAMTGAERQARYRTARLNGAPIVRLHRPADRRTRIQRWNDTVGELVELQGEYAAWLDAVPDSQQDSATADALRAIVELDVPELLAIEPPRGFGRD